MDAERWLRVEALFHRALGFPQQERQGFLTAECAGDADLLADVLGLLEEDARGGTVLDRELPEVVSAVLGGGAAPDGQLGPYRLLRVLGEGGMGVVFLAEREDLGSRAAIKILRDAALSPARRERFVSEQRTLAGLTHPNIARLLDAAVLPDGTPYFVMEYVEGAPLTGHVRDHDCSVAERMRLFRDLCEAVQFAHRHLIVHRDLKPSNVLVTADGTVKLLDFGIAKQLENVTAPADQTQTALRLMTPAYAAPEQVRGEPVGVHTDVYALGVILYELLTGRLPFDLSRRTPGEVEAVILDRDPERPSVAARRSELDGAEPVRARSRSAWADLDVLCLTAMQKDPQRRYRTVEALIRDVDHFLRGEPLDARPDSLRYRVGKFVRRNRRPVGATAAVLVMVVALVGFYTVRLAAARDAALAEAARTQRIQGFMLSLFEGGDPAAGPADTLRVLSLLDRGVREARALAAEPLLQAELYHTLGGLYRKLGSFERADTLLRSAVAQRQALLGDDHADVAVSLVALGLLRADQAEMEESERLVQDGLAIGRRHFPPDHPLVLEAITALGYVLQTRGALAEAIAVLEEAVRLRSQRGPATAELAASLGELANTHFYAGNYLVADSLNRELLGMNRRLYGERHPHVADDLINIGAIHFQAGRYAEAERFYRQGLDIVLGHYGTDHYRHASGLTMLGRALVSQGKYDEADEVLDNALEIQQRVFGARHPRVASIRNELGRIALRRNDLATAEQHYETVAAIYRDAYGERHQFVGIALSNLGNVAAEAGDLDRATELLREAVALFTGALGPDHVDTGIGRIKLGEALARQGLFEPAESELLAGYERVARHSDPSSPWLQKARGLLADVYEARGRPDAAARYRAEAAAAEASSD